MSLAGKKITVTANIHLLFSDKGRAKVVGSFRTSNSAAFQYLADEICTRIVQLGVAEADLSNLKSLISRQLFCAFNILNGQYPIEDKTSFTITHMNLVIDMTMQVADYDFDDMQVSIDGFGNIHV